MTIIIIQARLGSTRLPRKITLAMAGQPMLAHVVKRARVVVSRYREADAVVISSPYADVAEISAMGLGIPVIGGSHPDIASAYAEIAVSMNADIIVRITGDCPLIDPSVIVRLIAMVRDGTPLGLFSYVANVGPDSFFPDGFDAEAFLSSALYGAVLDDDYPMSPDDQEHVTPHIRRHRRCLYLQPSLQAFRSIFKSDLSESEIRAKASLLKLSVDSRDDYARVSALIDQIESAGLCARDSPDPALEVEEDIRNSYEISMRYAFRQIP